MANGTNIHVNKVRLRVIAHSAAMESQGSVANFGGGNSGNADVDGLGFHVLAMQRNAVSMFTKIVVAPRSAIAADDVDRAVGLAEAGHQIVQQIELFQVIIFHVSGAMIAEKMIELRYGVRQIVIANTIHHVDVLALYADDRGAGDIVREMRLHLDRRHALCPQTGQQKRPQRQKFSSRTWSLYYIGAGRSFAFYAVRR